MSRDADRERILLEIAKLHGRLEEARAELEAVDHAVPKLDTSSYEGDTQTRRIDTRRPPRNDATVAEAPGAKGSERPPRPQSLHPATFGDDFDERYVRKELLGEGGMGEVWLCTDRRIGRPVAVKVLRPMAASLPKLRDRFLFEARVQGQLEHPSIVPVYELGVRADGSEYFIMKRVVGKTLTQVLRDLRASDRATVTDFSQRRLLAAFQSVCLAAELAHQRGVVHRDLKPSNIMLGSFGEVSVLDWGVAKRIRTDPPITPTPEAAAALDEANMMTGVGEVLGTPGYMSPEQSAGMSVTGQSDVFALGAILFEILTLHRFIPGESDTEVRVATITGEYEPRISLRYPELDIGPALDEICLRATAREPADRFPSARALHDAIDRYIEGESDQRRRRALSRRHTRAAIAALADVAEARGPDEARAARSRAIDEVMRALAFDAENATAMRTMMKLMTEVPAALTPEADDAVRALEADATRKTALRGSIVYLIVIGNLALSAFLGVKSWLVLGIASALLLGAASIAFYVSRMRRPDQRWGIPIVTLSSLGFALTSGLFGPFVFAPTLVAANVIAAAVGVGRGLRRYAVACGGAAVLLPIAAQYFGWLPRSWELKEGVIEIVPRVVSFSEPGITLFLAAVSVGAVVLPAFVVGVERDAHAEAQRRLTLSALQLAEFLPVDATVKRPSDGPREGPSPRDGASRDGALDASRVTGPPVARR